MTDDEIQVDLVDGRRLAVPILWYPRLADATPKQRAKFRLCGGGAGIHWPAVDEDLRWSDASFRDHPLWHDVRRRAAQAVAAWE